MYIVVHSIRKCGMSQELQVVQGHGLKHPEQDVVERRLHGG